MFKNLINIIFAFLIFVIIIIALWKNISNNNQDDSVGKRFAPPEISLKQILPLGTDDNGNDYLVKFSTAFQYNLYVSFITTAIFTVISIILGLGIGFQTKNLSKNQNILFLNRLKNLYFTFCSSITDVFQSIPILIVLLLGVLFFQRYLDNPDHSLFFTLVVVAVFSSPKLSNALGNHIKQLNREEFILATKASGVSMPALIVKHILYYEAKGLIVLQFINFFFFTIMLEIFLGFFGKGAGELSIGRLIGKDKILYGIDWQYLPTDQYKLILVFPLLFVLILCLVTRWLAKRVMLLTEN